MTSDDMPQEEEADSEGGQHAFREQLDLGFLHGGRIGIGD
jgi:hypothetical protein